MNLNSRKRWVLSKHSGNFEGQITKTLGLHPITARYLIERGIESLEAAEAYLSPSLGQMHDPALLKGIADALELLSSAFASGQTIGVYGDYDVDGLCSTSMLISFFRECGVDFEFAIPHREKEGYGVDIERIKEMAAEGVDILLTVDCGIRANEAVDAAKELGMDVLIVDHHQIPALLPDADAIINPHQQSCHYPYSEMSASGISFNLLVALRSQLRKDGFFEERPEPELKDLLDLVALGTVADAMPLEDINRIFVRRGLQLLEQNPRPGVEAILSQLRYRPMPITTESISYQIAPRINAAGRMSDATFCVELLTTPDFRKASQLASRLERLNKKRKKLQSEILEEARSQADEQMASGKQLLMVSKQNWKPGLLGIVAGRLTDRYQRPALAIGGEEAIRRGSGRSIPNFNLFELLQEASDIFERFGGHEAAAGFSIHQRNIETLQERLTDVLEDTEHGIGELQPELPIQERTTIRELREFSEELKYLRPFGTANSAPMFLLPSVRSRWTKTVGDGSHLKAEFRDESGAMEGIGFSMGDRLEQLDESVAVVAKPTRSEFRGRVQTELQLSDLRIADNVDSLVDGYRDVSR